MMRYCIIVSEKAGDMLQRHIAFIANVSKRAARDQKNEIISAIKKLKEDADIYSCRYKTGIWPAAITETNQDINTYTLSRPDQKKAPENRSFYYLFL